MTQSEASSMKMIKPCQCTGSGAYVHLACLNSWRETSKKAYTSCSICNYNYKVKKSKLSKYLVNERITQFVTLFLFLLGVFFCGFMVLILVPKITDFDLPIEIFVNSGIYPWWKECRISQSFYRQRTFFSLLTSGNIISQIYESLLCNLIISYTIDIIFFGVIIFGGFGLLYSVYHDICTFYRVHRIGGVEVIEFALGRLICFSAALTSNRIFLFRIGCPIGCHYIISKVNNCYVFIQLCYYTIMLLYNYII